MKHKKGHQTRKTIPPGTECGWLTVLRPGPMVQGTVGLKSTSVCRCRCGRETTVLNANFNMNLKKGSMMSCGCYASSFESRSFRFSGPYAGESTTRLANEHRQMMSRCYDKKNKSWKFYGAHGVAVCEQWRDYRVFKEWALANGYRDDLTLDRIDFLGDYEPSNCRWITIQEQQLNKRSNRWLTYKGQTKPMMAWANELGVNYHLLRSRLNYGWTVERALETPSDSRFNRPNVIYVEYHGETKPLIEWARCLGLTYETLKYRYYKKWPVEKMLSKGKDKYEGKAKET